MNLIKLDNNLNFKDRLNLLGCDRGGVEIMSKKMNLNLIYIENIKSSASNILKQDALSIGAELATPKGVITCKDEFVDAILIATDKQLEILSKKELAQPFGLKNLAKELKKFIYKPQSKSKIMGVINANDDSFYQNSRFKGSEAIQKIENMISDGADIIDIGAVSSRPGSQKVSSQEELNRVRDTVDEIYRLKLYEKVDFSIDSYQEIVVKYALERGFNIVNDITGLKDDAIAKAVSEFDATVVIMHMQNSPETMQDNPIYKSVISDISLFFQERIEKAKNFNIDKVILDVGIGFGKSLEHNLELIKHLKHFRKFGLEILIGASRKSMIDKIYPSEIDERLAGTLAIHLKAIENGASIIRCHDVKEHKQAISILETINSI